MERRDPKKKEKSKETIPIQASPLPKDYVKMVVDVFAKNFSKGLKKLSEYRAGPAFYIEGQIFTNEIVVSVSIIYPNEITATTVYSSADFDPVASAPKAEEVLSALIDGAAAFYDRFLNSEEKEKFEQLASSKLSVFEEDVPFNWRKFEFNQIEIFLKVDRSNPILDHQANQLLKESQSEDSDK